VPIYLFGVLLGVMIECGRLTMQAGIVHGHRGVSFGTELLLADGSIGKSSYQAMLNPAGHGHQCSEIVQVRLSRHQSA